MCQLILNFIKCFFSLLDTIQECPYNDKKSKNYTIVKVSCIKNKFFYYQSKSEGWVCVTLDPRELGGWV